MSAHQNDLIARLPPVERHRLLDIAEPVDLVLSEWLYRAGSPIAYVYFPIEGFISLLTAVDGDRSLEVGMVGFEGMVGTPLGLGVDDSPVHAVVQGPGSAWRIASTPYHQAYGRSPALRGVLGRYVHVLMAQLATSAACLRYHPVEARLARWLLMTQDRARSDRFEVTHDFLAYMLGVRRVSVTLAAGALQRVALIHYHRGEVQVLDRPGLQARACGCYGDALRLHQATLGPAPA